MNQALLVLRLELFQSGNFTPDKFSRQEFLHGTQFKVHGIAASFPNGHSVFEADAAAFLKNLQGQYGSNLEQATVVVYEPLEAYVLKERFGGNPAMVVDIVSMNRLLNSPLGNICALSSSLNSTYRLSRIQMMELRRYALSNIAEMRKVAEEMLAVIPLQELDMINHTIHCFLDSPLLIDVERLGQARNELIIGLHEGISPYQLDDLRNDLSFAQLLESKLGHRIDTKPGANGAIPALAQDDEFMRGLQKHEDAEIRKLVEKRLLAKAFSAYASRIDYLQGTANLTSGVLPVHLNYAKAISGRFTGGNNFNIQNLPHPDKISSSVLQKAATVIRQSIHAPEGMALVAVDAAQIEARVLAWLVDEEELSKAFANNEDVYSTFAGAVFNEPVKKMSGDSPEARRMRDLRTIGKTAILGLGYRMGASCFRNRLKVQAASAVETMFASERELNVACRDIVNQYRNRYKKISAFWCEIEEAFREAILTGAEQKVGKVSIHPETDRISIGLPSGRRIVYLSPRISEQEKRISYIDKSGETRNFMAEGSRMTYCGKELHGGVLTENIVQGIARDLLVNAIFETEKKGHRVIIHIHDEIIAITPESQAKLTVNDMISAWRNVPDWAPELVLDAEGTYGKNLLDIK